MRELPILFSTPMVQAIQAGTKNQTRRTAGLEKVNENPNDWKLTGIALRCKGVFGKIDYEMNFIFPFSNKKGETVKCKPRYQKGDHIWVKETFTIIPPQSIVYRAGYTSSNQPKWKSSLFMRKEYARIWLECTGVRCERLMSISEEDACNEGVESIEHPDFRKYKQYEQNEFKLEYASHSFFSLWRKINGNNSGTTNPWVFIYEFKRIEK